jgi:HAD superfamily hydrolase (TIGR01450 family)
MAIQKVSFKKIVKNFKAVFIDSYGVLKNHSGLIDGADETIHFLREEGLAIRILTNDASRSQLQQLERFNKLGLNSIKEDEIITSGMLARQFLELKIRKGKVAYLGTEDSAKYIFENGLEGIPVSEIEVDDAKHFDAFLFLDDEGFDWNSDINKTVNFLRRKNLPIIVANSDKYYPISNNDVAVAIGAISRLVESVLNQKFIRFGKPDSQMFTFAFDGLNKFHNFKRHEVLMVGDTLHTDILGGNKFGLQTLLVLSGNTRPESAEMKINASGIIPDYISDSILT